MPYREFTIKEIRIVEAAAFTSVGTLLCTALHADRAQHDRQLDCGGSGLHLLALKVSCLLRRETMLSDIPDLPM